MKDKRFEIVETEGTAKGIFVIVDRKTAYIIMRQNSDEHEGYSP